MITIRAFEQADWPEIWAILKPIFRTGETYTFAPDISEADARAAWVTAPFQTFVARDENGVALGTYYIKANQPGLGAHVCNCGYATSEAARGRGVASTMCDHSQEVAREAGFLHMQYNLVAASNEGAVRLWKRHGFAVVGTLPGAFKNLRLGYVDAHVMYKTL
ncbi:MAG: GNAT family N-acetyltransferase [Pikeienuella sp.]